MQLLYAIGLNVAELLHFQSQVRWNPKNFKSSRGTFSFQLRGVLSCTVLLLRRDLIPEKGFFLRIDGLMRQSTAVDRCCCKKRRFAKTIQFLQKFKLKWKTVREELPVNYKKATYKKAMCEFFLLETSTERDFFFQDKTLAILLPVWYLFHNVWTCWLWNSCICATLLKGSWELNGTDSQKSLLLCGNFFLWVLWGNILARVVNGNG